MHQRVLPPFGFLRPAETEIQIYFRMITIFLCLLTILFLLTGVLPLLRDNTRKIAGKM